MSVHSRTVLIREINGAGSNKRNGRTGNSNRSGRVNKTNGGNSSKANGRAGNSNRSGRVNKISGAGSSKMQIGRRKFGSPARLHRL